jgi:pyridoxamine 5'-phosphate oxidase
VDGADPGDALDEHRVAADPIVQFGEWYRAAVEEMGDGASAMGVATATPDGQPSVRMVLLRGFDARGFVFYTSYESRKAAELARNARAALLFHWPARARQVRIEGPVAPVTRDESAAYFATRPRGHQLGAWASHQSAPVAGRAALEADLAAVEARFAGGPVPLPERWGGYRVAPEQVELWAGRADRLHDRVRYSRAPGAPGWVIERLGP